MLKKLLGQRRIETILLCAAILCFLFSNFIQNKKITLSYDAYGIPIILNGSLEEVWNKIGYAMAKDRLFQLFLIAQEANYQTAQFFGADFLPGNILQATLSYTDEELNEQFDSLTKQTKENVIAWVTGINESIAEVNANNRLLPYEFKLLQLSKVPLFSRNELLRTGLYILQSFVDASFPFFQLKNICSLMHFITLTNSAEKGFAIFNDLIPSHLHVQHTIVPQNNGTPHTLAKAIATTPKIAKQDREVAVQINNFVQKIKEIRKVRLERAIGCTLGSYGVVIGKEKSLTGNPLLLAGPQTNFNFPNDFWEVHVASSQADFKAHFFTIPGLPLVPIGTFQTWASTMQVSCDVLANDFLIEPSKNKMFLKTVTIKVKDAQPYNVDIFRSKSGGWVVEQLTNDTILTLRSIFLGKQLRYLDSLMQMVHAKNFNDYKTIVSNQKNSSDLMLFLSQFADSEQTIAAIHLGLWTSLPNCVDRRFPLGTPFNPTYEYDNSSLQLPLFDTNNPQGFYASWNNPFRTDLPLFSSGNPNKGNKVYWIIDYITKKTLLSCQDLENLLFHIGAANCFEGVPKDSGTIRISGADLFVPLFKKKFFEIIQLNPTPQRLEALALLHDFDGRWIITDKENFADNRTINDQWLLAQNWLLNVLRLFFQPMIPKKIFNNSTKDSLNSFSTSVTILHLANALARIIGTDPCKNPVHFKWQSLENLDHIVLTS